MKGLFNILFKLIGGIIILMAIVGFTSGDIIMAAIVMLIGILLFRYSYKFSQEKSIKDKDSTNKRPDKNLSNKSAKNQNLKKVTIKDNIGDFIEIEEIGLFGQYDISANKKYIIVYKDGHYENDKYIKGEYAFIKNNNLVIHKKMPRPNDGKVANNGNFIINDWGNSEKLSGTFYTLNESGNIIIKKKFKANLYNNGLSNNGEFAVCQMANSPHEEYSSKLFLFDLEKGKLINSFVPKTGWADNYSFDIKNNELVLIYKDENSYRYNFNGKLLDKEKWENSVKNSDNPYTVFYDLEEKYKQLSEDVTKKELNNFLENFMNLLETEISSSDNLYSKLHRYIGELNLELGNEKEALNYFEKALEINEKVGVKRVIKRLRKKLNQ